MFNLSCHRMIKCSVKSRNKFFWYEKNWKSCLLWLTLCICNFGLYNINPLTTNVTNMSRLIIIKKQLLNFTSFSYRTKDKFFRDLAENLVILWQDKVNIPTFVGIFTLSCHITIDHCEQINLFLCASKGWCYAAA